MFPKNLRYTKQHEWLRDDGGTYTVGITSFAAEQLGDVTYVEVPEIGVELKQGGEAGAVESVKAASDIYAPASGTVTEINASLEDKPELVNESPYDEGWFFKLSGVDESELDNLMDTDAYDAFVEEQDH